MARIGWRACLRGQVVLRFMDFLPSQEAARAVAKKLAPPLVTLLSSEPEMQVALLRVLSSPSRFAFALPPLRVRSSSYSCSPFLLFVFALPPLHVLSSSSWCSRFLLSVFAFPPLRFRSSSSSCSLFLLFVFSLPPLRVLSSSSPFLHRTPRYHHNHHHHQYYYRHPQGAYISGNGG
jgi:hypothetical protein